MEGPFARDLLVCSNRFINSPPDGSTIIVSMHPPGGSSNARRFKAKPVTNLTIIGNYFGRSSKTPIIIHNEDGLNIHGNSIYYPLESPAYKGLANSSEFNWLNLQDCEHVSIQDNQTPAK